MKSFSSIFRHTLRLIRIPNLLLIIFAQYLVRYCLILPAYKVSYLVTGEFPEHLSSFYFSLLCVSTLLVAIGGYIINDVNDVVVDSYNKPGKNVIGKLLTEKSASLLSNGLFTTGIILGFIVAYKIGKPVMGFIHVFSAFSLHMYSSFYQKRVLSGNLLIALLTALSLLLVGLYEPNFYPNFIYLLWYAGIAFTLTFTRELIKDIEDAAGDEKAQYITFPVRYGVPAAKRLVMISVILNLILISWILYTFFYDNTILSFWYLETMFAIPLLALLYMTWNAHEKKDWSYASSFTKFIMAAGIFSMVGLWYYFLR